MNLRPVEDTFISTSCARSRPGGGVGVEDGGLLLEWIKLRYGTRVTVLKLSFNGRQCQKLSLSISSVLLSLSLEPSMLICYFVMVSRRTRSTLSAL